MINTYDLSLRHPDYFKELAAKNLLFAYYKCPQEERKVNLYSRYNNINYTLKGKKIMHHRERSWLLYEDTSFFIKRTAFNQERFWETDWELMAFYFPDSFLQQVLKEYYSCLPLRNLPLPATDMIVQVNINDSTRAFFYSMVPYFGQVQTRSENLLELKFKELLFNVLSNPANAPLLAYTNSIMAQHKPLLHEIMEANFSFNLTLSGYARIAQRSLSTFKRDFEEQYHTTPGKWLSEKRLHYAKRLLTSSSKNVNEIAYDSGFENVSHFSRVFKEKFGTAPLQYRNNHCLTPKKIV